MVGETLPQVAAEHRIVQVTPRLTGSLVTVATNCIEVPATTVAEGLDTLTVINEGGVLEPPQPASKGATNAPQAIQWARTLLFVHIAAPPLEHSGPNGYQGPGAFTNNKTGNRSNSACGGNDVSISRADLV